MKRMGFLIKIKKEGKIEIIESSEEMKQAYIKKSVSNLESSKILLENNNLEESISLTYYSMYHMLIALLFKIEIKCENHAASIILLKKLFDLNNSDISNAKKERIDKQYYTDFEIIKEDIIVAIKNAEIFNAKLFDFISRLTNEDIKGYRDKFRELIDN